jgi:hypothetical protein
LYIDIFMYYLIPHLMVYIEVLVYFKGPSESSNDFIVFFIDSELVEVYANLPLKVLVDNPYRKFGRNRRNYWYVTEEIIDHLVASKSQVLLF